MNISEKVHSSSGILVYFEIFKNEIRPVSFELLGEAYRLSKNQMKLFILLLWEKILIL